MAGVSDPFSGEGWIMCWVHGYTFSASHFPCSHAGSTTQTTNTTGSLSSSSSLRGRLCHRSTPQAFHLHPLLPCGPPNSKWLPPTSPCLVWEAGVVLEKHDLWLWFSPWSLEEQLPCLHMRAWQHSAMALLPSDPHEHSIAETTWVFRVVWRLPFSLLRERSYTHSPDECYP